MSVKSVEISLTCNIKSAAKTSSKVALKAAINSVGRSDINPTVSERITFIPLLSSRARILGSSVANSIFSEKTFAPVNKLNKVDFPAFV